jgi:L-iditol 2-dehydrogenase
MLDSSRRFSTVGAMKALTLTEYKKFEFGDAPEPEVAPGEVLIRVQACGICGSDVHGMDGSSGRRIPPVIMGHEASGIVESVAPDVTDWKKGDRVTFDSMIFCGECDYCKSGRTNLCDNRMVMGVSCPEYRRNGAFAEFVNIPGRLLIRIPDNVTFEQAAFVEPVSVALHAVNRVPVQKGDTAVVVGAGMIGLLVLQALRIAGAEKLICVDLEPKRLDIARQLGADHCFHAKDDDVVAEVLKLTNGIGADVVMEVVGITPTIQTAINCLRLGGSLGCVGNISKTVEFPLQAIVTREITVYGTCGATAEPPEALRHIAEGSIDVGPLTSAVAPLEEGGAWFERLYSGKEDLMKVILTPNMV